MYCTGLLDVSGARQLTALHSVSSLDFKVTRRPLLVFTSGGILIKHQPSQLQIGLQPPHLRYFFACFRSGLSLTPVQPPSAASPPQTWIWIFFLAPITIWTWTIYFAVYLEVMTTWQPASPTVNIIILYYVSDPSHSPAWNNLSWNHFSSIFRKDENHSEGT